MERIRAEIALAIRRHRVTLAALGLLSVIRDFDELLAELVEEVERLKETIK